jgi:2-haloacid dehalogenase
MKRVVVFDVLGTLFSLDAVRAGLTDAGAPPATLEAWFERTLHGTLTLSTVGEFRPFREVARAALQTTLAQLELDVAQAEEILAGLSGVQPHDDAAAALDRLAGENARIVALTNSGAQQTEEILEQAKLRDRFERVFSVSDVGAYKPDRRPYEHVVKELGGSGGRSDADCRPRLGRRRRPCGRTRIDLGGQARAALAAARCGAAPSGVALGRCGGVPFNHYWRR